MKLAGEFYEKQNKYNFKNYTFMDKLKRLK